MYEALSPIIGQGGVAALYMRTVHLACAQYPWLSAVYEASLPAGDFTALRAAMAGQFSAQATAAHDSMMQSLHELLHSLIGASLTARLLPPVPTPISASPAVQDHRS